MVDVRADVIHGHGYSGSAPVRSVRVPFAFRSVSSGHPLPLLLVADRPRSLYLLLPLYLTLLLLSPLLLLTNSMGIH
jgi:hypothetical protein